MKKHSYVSNKNDSPLFSIMALIVHHISTHTNLCVPSANIKHGGVVGFGDESSHLDVSDAVVDTEQRLPPKLGDSTSYQGYRYQRGAHSRTCKRRRV